MEKMFEVKDMQYIVKSNNTFKVMVLEELQTDQRFHIEVDVQEYSEYNNTEIDDILTLLIGDMVSITMKEFTGSLSSNNGNIIKAIRLDPKIKDVIGLL